MNKKWILAILVLALASVGVLAQGKAKAKRVPDSISLADKKLHAVAEPARNNRSALVYADEKGINKIGILTICCGMLSVAAFPTL